VYAARVITSNEDIARKLQDTLELKTPPVALVFSDSPPVNVPKVTTAAPAGCSYWKRAAEGEVFYTTGADHLGCAVGAYTHGAELGAEGEKMLTTMIGTMTGLGYLAEGDIPEIPKMPKKLAFVTYGPLARVSSEADVVLLRATPRAAMLVNEALHAAGARSPSAPVMRPACAMVPQVMATQRGTSSFGCIGNRVYTGLPDGEVWMALSGHELSTVVAQLETTASANRELEAFHRGRLQAN
jgi:uncharacterized protein (DUF169 family)